MSFSSGEANWGQIKSASGVYLSETVSHSNDFYCCLKLAANYAVLKIFLLLHIFVNAFAYFAFKIIKNFTVQVLLTLINLFNDSDDN
jgi:hypothetical protein